MRHQKLALESAWSPATSRIQRSSAAETGKRVESPTDSGSTPWVSRAKHTGRRIAPAIVLITVAVSLISAVGMAQSYADVVVSGFGFPCGDDVNGAYPYSNTFNGKPRYRSDRVSIAWTSEQEWQFYHMDLELEITVIATNSADTSLPPANGWVGEYCSTAGVALSGGVSTTHTLTISTVGQGTVSPSSGEYEAGTSVQLTANPSTNWGFSMWSGDLSGSANPKSITMDGDKSVTATFMELPDLTITDIDFSGVGCISDGLEGQIDVIVHNNGPATASSIAVSLELPGGPAFTNQTVASLASGTSATVSFALAGNWSDCTDCDHSFTATVDPGNAILETNESNNARTETTTSTLPNLTVTDIDFSGIGCASDGPTGTIEVTIRNDGCATATNVEVALTTDGGPTFADQTVALLDGSGATTTVSFGLSEGWTDCTDCSHSFTATVDPDDALCECTGTDNARTETYTSTLPDLTVTDIDFTNVGCGSDALTGTVDVTIRNDGCATATDVVVSLSTDGGPTFADQTVPTISGGGVTAVVSLELNGMWADCTDCTHAFTATVDPGDAICECDGTNNAYNKDYMVVGIPDLAVSADTLTVLCTQVGVSISGDVTLRNYGCGSYMGPVDVRLWLYDQPGGAGSLVEEWTESFNVSLAAGGGTETTAIDSREVACDLSGCQAVSIQIAVDSSDAICECNGADNARCVDKMIVDTVKPEIHNLSVDQHVLVDDCCEAVVTFDGYVLDDCCVAPEDITVTVTNSTGNATVSFERANVTFTSVGKYRVDFVGEIHVICLTSCPSFIEVTVNAVDSCGNAADTVTSVADPADLHYNGGDLYDETAPDPRDDPDGDEDRSASDNLEVRLDGYGQHRLMVREDTPVGIDVVWNDTDNCSACTCERHLWIDDIVTPPGYGTATIEDAESSVSDPGTAIRYAPYYGYYGKDEFTYRIVDACGNTSEATVYIEVVAQTVMDDLYLTTCVDTPVSFDAKTTDLWIDPEVPSEIPFVFSIVTPPIHGVISGDLGAVTYAAHGATTEEIESATITLVYTPAAGFTGRDALTLRFSDPFGGSSTAVVDIAVIECAGQSGGPPLFVVQQGEIFPLIVPLTFAVVYEKEWHTVTVQAIDATGTLYNEALSATWEESIGRYVLRLDTASLPPGLYRMTIPLGNGETVSLMIEVGEAV